MILSRRVALDGVQLDEKDERIVITGIDEDAGKDTISTVSSAAANGQRITTQRRDTLDVTVRFKLLVRKEDMITREALLEVVNAWAARGGWLQVGHKPQRKILVVLAQAPGAGNMFNWTNEYSIVFRAYAVPYWEDENPVSVRGGTAASGSLWLNVPGNTRTVMSVVAQNRSGMTIDTLSITAAGQTIAFNGLRLGGSSALTIDYNQTQKLFVIRNRIGSTSVMAARTVTSADEFVLDPGSCQVSWSAQRAVQLTCSCRGRYL